MFEEIGSSAPTTRAGPRRLRWAAVLLVVAASTALLGPAGAGAQQPAGQVIVVARPLAVVPELAGGAAIDSAASADPAEVIVPGIAYSAAPALSLLVTGLGVLAIGALVLLANGYANRDARRRPGRG